MMFQMKMMQDAILGKNMKKAKYVPEILGKKGTEIENNEDLDMPIPPNLNALMYPSMKPHPP